MARIKKVFLEASEMPTQWYNLAADLPTPMLPPLGPDGNPISPDMLAPVFPMNLIEQEVSTQRWIDRPEEVIDLCYGWRRALQSCPPPLASDLGIMSMSYYIWVGENTAECVKL